MVSNILTEDVQAQLLREWGIKYHSYEVEWNEKLVKNEKLLSFHVPFPFLSSTQHFYISSLMTIRA